MIVAHPLVHDSFWIDYVWAGRFHDELAAGHFYPRWLSGSFGGLGAPVFAFYAPLAFYATAIPIALGLPVYPALIATFVAFHWASGVTMHRWLGGRGRAAFGGALLYMLLPYHLLDFARRGALAEFAAYAVLPLVARGIDKNDTRAGFIGLAVAYAALVMTHLPTALLASVLLIPALVLRRQAFGQTLRTGAALLIGLLLASAYLLPALALQHFGNMTSLWAKPGYHPEAWSLYTPQRWPTMAAGLLFVTLEAVLALAAAMLGTRRNWFWTAIGLVACLVAADAIPGFWSVPALAKVQFPWRALAIAEFATATAFAQWLANPGRRRWAGYALLPALVIGVPILLAPYPHGHPTLAELDRARPDVPEYLPAGTTFRSSAQAEALARAMPDAIIRGGWTIRRRFWFPDVSVRCGGRNLPTIATPVTRLLAYRAPAGCVAAIGTGASAIETIGWVGSALGLVVLLGVAVGPSLARRAAGRR